MDAIFQALRRGSRKLRSFRRDDRGAIAIQFAFLALPLTVLAFGMVDVNRASVGKKDLQDALDAATLIAARSTAVTSAQLDAVGDSALGGQLTGQLPDATLTSSTFSADGSTVHGEAVIKLTPIVANLWLKTDMTVTAKSDVVRSMNKLEVAMVLDTTGSMAGSKLTNLKTAAKDFITQMGAAAARSTETNPVKIGLVPFSNAVRIAGTTAEVNAYKTAAWMDVAGDAPVSKEIFWNTTTNNLTGKVNRFTMMSNMGVTWGGCVEGRAIPYDVQETAPGPSVPATLITPYFWPDEADNDNGSINEYADDEESSGWSQDRRLGNSGKYDSSATPSGTSRGPNKGCDMQPISRLSTDWTALKDKVDTFNAAGETHIPLGLMWGWHLLSPSGPFGDGVPYSTPKTTKVVVLMTDGDNTYTYANNDKQSNYDGYGFAAQGRIGTTSTSESVRTAAIDSRLTLLCTNMKAAGIVIYTVRVEVKSGSSSLLQNCASTPDKFYDVQSASNLTAVFSAIAGSIQNLRISS